MMRTYYYGDRDGLHLQPCEADDEHRFVPRADFAAQFAALDGQLPDGPKWTLYNGAAVRGVGGFSRDGPGHLSAWALLADLRPREWLGAAKLAVGVIQYARRQGEGHRIQAIPAATPAACRLLRFMGFRFAWKAGGVSTYLFRETL